MGFRMAKPPAIFLARLRGNHIKIVETWQAASIITLAFSFSVQTRVLCPYMFLLQLQSGHEGNTVG